MTEQNSRRRFLTQIAAGAGAVALARPIFGGNFAELERNVASVAGRTADDVASDEAFWGTVRSGFDLEPAIVNLDNGYCNPLSRAVMNDLAEKMRWVETLPGRRVEELFETVTSKKVIPGLAKMLGVPDNEIALTRNATESLDTVILGMDFKPGDEILCCNHDYYSMLDAIERRKLRDGVSIKMLKPPLPAASDRELLEMYRNAITPRTKLVLVTHASNVTGQIYPVRRIAAAAHWVGAKVLVDAAQTFAVLDHKIPDLDCDFYGVSLHKWLMGPVGSGLLWMRKENVDKIWPLVPPPVQATGMYKFMWSGTYPEFLSGSLTVPIEFHEKLGMARKEARLRYLGEYWRKKVEKLPGVRFYTTDSPAMSCGLGVFEMEGVDLSTVQKALWEKKKILVQFMDGGPRARELKGIRVTPNVYTTTAELDKFVAALAEETAAARK